MRQPWDNDKTAEAAAAEEAVPAAAVDTLTRGFSDMLGRTSSADAKYPGQADVDLS